MHGPNTITHRQHPWTNSVPLWTRTEETILQNKTHQETFHPLCPTLPKRPPPPSLGPTKCACSPTPRWDFFTGTDARYLSSSLRETGAYSPCQLDHSRRRFLHQRLRSRHRPSRPPRPTPARRPRPKRQVGNRSQHRPSPQRCAGPRRPQRTRPRPKRLVGNRLLQHRPSPQRCAGPRRPQRCAGPRRPETGSNQPRSRPPSRPNLRHHSRPMQTRPKTRVRGRAPPAWAPGALLFWTPPVG